jgi:hypothetical protein
MDAIASSMLAYGDASGSEEQIAQASNLISGNVAAEYYRQFYA